MERIPFWKSYSRLAIQDIFLSLWEQNFRFLYLQLSAVSPYPEADEADLYAKFLCAYFLSYVTTVCQGRTYFFFFKNLGTVSMFKATEGWNNASSVVVTKNLGWPLNRSVFWRFWYMFSDWHYTAGNCCDPSGNVRRHYIKFSPPGFVHPCPVSNPFYPPSFDIPSCIL